MWFCVYTYHTEFYNKVFDVHNYWLVCKFEHKIVYWSGYLFTLCVFVCVCKCASVQVTSRTGKRFIQKQKTTKKIMRKDVASSLPSQRHRNNPIVGKESQDSSLPDLLSAVQTLTSGEPDVTLNKLSENITTLAKPTRILHLCIVWLCWTQTH